MLATEGVLGRSAVKLMCCVFFSSRRRHTRFDCDWSSDVCSSDLWLRVGGVKMSIDGGITGRNACFYDPYEDDEHNYGIIRIQQDELNDTVQKCHDAGLRCCEHAIGDRAFDMALDAYENAVKK